MTEHESDNLADAMLDATVDSVMSATDPHDAIRVLEMIAGSTDKVFTNLVSNSPENAIRLTLFRMLQSLHAVGRDDAVMEIMDTLAEATLIFEPDALQKGQERFREQFNQEHGHE